jgi:hypothetical protein
MIETFKICLSFFFSPFQFSMAATSGSGRDQDETGDLDLVSKYFAASKWNNFMRRQGLQK